MLRVLHVFLALPRGGSETFVMNIHRNIDRSKIQFDYLIHTPSRQDYEDEIEALGGKVWRAERSGILHYFQYRNFWRKFLTEHTEYKIIHGHYNNTAAIYLSVAKSLGRIAIVHSHSTKFPMRSWRDLRFRTCVYPVRFIADYFMACSNQAGIDRFGSKVDVKFIPNGIDTSKYRFSHDVRNSIRESRHVSPNTLVIGHVGNFYPVKNHKFLIDVFKEIHEQDRNSKLWLLGRNIDKYLLEEGLRKQVHEYDLDDAVDFIGAVGNVNEYLQGMDVFAFPSFQEGLSVALLEAQTSGLPCVISSAIHDGIISDRVAKLDILPPDICVKKWKDEIMKASFIRDDREIYPEIIAKAGFDVKATAQKMQDFYLSLV